MRSEVNCAPCMAARPFFKTLLHLPDCLDCSFESFVILPHPPSPPFRILWPVRPVCGSITHHSLRPRLLDGAAVYTQSDSAVPQAEVRRKTLGGWAGSNILSGLCTCAPLSLGLGPRWQRCATRNMAIDSKFPSKVT